MKQYLSRINSPLRRIIISLFLFVLHMLDRIPKIRHKAGAWSWKPESPMTKIVQFRIGGWVVLGNAYFIYIFQIKPELFIVVPIFNVLVLVILAYRIMPKLTLK
jgi:hypothetical protein